jgi:hypothetical protein
MFFYEHSDTLKQKKTHEIHKTQNIQQWNIYFVLSTQVWKLRCKEATIDFKTCGTFSILQFL